jgi:hypothetical protein
MADIKNYTLNFGSGRPAMPALTCAARRSACTEVQRTGALRPESRNG